MHDGTARRGVILLALQAPVAGDLRVVIAALHASGHLKRMGNLARHIAVIARLKHPNPMIASEIRPVLARMGLLASQLAEDAATALPGPARYWIILVRVLRRGVSRATARAWVART